MLESLLNVISIGNIKSGISCFTFIILGIIIFFIGICGIIFSKKNIIVMLMAIELMLISVTFMFIVFAVFLDDILGYIVSLYILTVAAAESAIGLALLVVYYRLRGVILVTNMNKIKG